MPGYKDLESLQRQVVSEVPMFTLQASQRRGSTRLHWRVDRHKVEVAFIAPLRPTLNEMERASWEPYNYRNRDRPSRSSTPGPSPAAFRQFQAHLNELKPQADEIFQQVTAPRLMMESLNRNVTLPPRETLARQMEELLRGLIKKFEPFTERWPETLQIGDNLIITPASEILSFTTKHYSNGRAAPSLGWSGTPLGDVREPRKCP